VHANDELPASASNNAEDDNEAGGLRSGQIATDYRQELDWLFGHEATVTDLDYTPDGNYVVSCSRNGSVKVWDIAKKRVVRDLAGVSKNAWAVRVSPDGKLIAVGSGG
jgi:WD40 repeat protein